MYLRLIKSIKIKNSYTEKTKTNNTVKYEVSINYKGVSYSNKESFQYLVQRVTSIWYKVVLCNKHNVLELSKGSYLCLDSGNSISVIS